MFASTLLFAIGFFLTQVLADKNIALYWGQNSFGDQGTLASYCDSSDFDIVIISFVNSFPNLNLNLANQCGNTFNDGLLHCSAVGQDIKTCQQKGKKVLLSLGGSIGNYGFSSDAEATAFATTLWNKFGGGSATERPFDDAVVDGFDFDFEKQNQVGTVALANSLKALFNSDSSKQYYLSASPQCPYPDASVGNVLASVPLDYAFIQFYNNQCALNGQFNWNAWESFAESAPNPNIKLFVGLPGGPASASSGYVDLATVEQQITKSILSSKNFGGFSLWDASSATNNVNSAGLNFYQQLKNFLLQSVVSSSSAAPTSTAITTSSTNTPAQTSLVVPPAINSTTTTDSGKGDATVVHTTLIKEIYITTCPDEVHGGLTTSIATKTKTVTFTGECECTKGGKQVAETTGVYHNGTVATTSAATRATTLLAVSLSSAAPLVLSTYVFNSSSKSSVSLFAMLVLSLLQLL